MTERPDPAPDETTRAHRWTVDDAAERAVLGAVYHDPGLVPVVAPILKWTDFSHPRLGVAFAAIARAAREGRRLDPEELARHLESFGIEPFDARAFLASLPGPLGRAELLRAAEVALRLSMARLVLGQARRILSKLDAPLTGQLEEVAEYGARMLEATVLRLRLASDLRRLSRGGRLAAGPRVV